MNFQTKNKKTEMLFNALYVSGNFLVIITIFRFMNRESVTNLFIANLSFGDILVIEFALPFRVSEFYLS